MRIQHWSGKIVMMIIFNSGCTGDFHHDNLQCSQWLNIFQCDALPCSVAPYRLSKISDVFFSFHVSMYFLLWRHDGHNGVSNLQPHDCLLHRLFRRRSKKTSKLRVTGLCVGNSPVTGEFPAQRASNAGNVSIWWRHHAMNSNLAYLYYGGPNASPHRKLFNNQVVVLICPLHHRSNNSSWWIGIGTFTWTCISDVTIHELLMVSTECCCCFWPENAQNCCCFWHPWCSLIQLLLDLVLVEVWM